MSSVDAAVLLDGGEPIIYADVLDHIEIVGPLAKFVFCSVHVTVGGEDRRDAGMLIIPWDALPGGVAGLRQAFGERVLPRRPMMAS